ncbi:ImmA/IrrE family metallo-endopeptidase [Kushneria aurantia]|uniref:ImmA/IrrE family metallo-endopeptidase n=1 Tax=Kushneria aurantia TaxID=504092 RepID=A0ABV6G2Z9_9GAMM|nr:ImmA/IrrE family metallo-endopeptidase [Kushneria aurantia]
MLSGRSSCIAAVSCFADEHQNRRRFTMAHELGHVLMGHVQPGVEPRRDTNFNAYGDPLETGANAFAAELLMPEAEIRRHAHSATDVRHLAGIFGVSTSAISNRLKNLGIA